MRRIFKASVACITALFIVSALPVDIAGCGQDVVTDTIAEVAGFLAEAVPYPGIGQAGGDWTVIALSRCGAVAPEGYFGLYYSNATAMLGTERGILSNTKYSEYSRVALAVSSVGGNPRDVGGYDLIAPLLDFEKTVFQGVNGPAFAIIALAGTGNGSLPVIERYIDHLLAQQFEDGGFAMSGNASDPDTTAMVLTALSVCLSRGEESRADIAAAIDRGVARLSALQKPTGGYDSYLSVNSESVSQVIIALCCLGIPVNDVRFVKDGNSLLDNLLSYKTDGGGFEHEQGGGVSLMATEQALCALAAIWRYQTGINSLFDMSDAPEIAEAMPPYGLPGRNPDIGVVEISDPGDIFTGIGLREDGYVTRAEFIGAIIRALGLKGSMKAPGFIDLPPDHIFKNDIHAAFEYGIVEGRNPDVFDPDSRITRQEAAVVISRVSTLCGLGTGAVFDDTAVRNVLSVFTDYRTVAPWASAGLAFCIYFGIIDDEASEVRPSEQIETAEASNMIFSMLEKSRLLIVNDKPGQ